ncbi:hypothetical protein V7S79_06000 [Aquirufa sp. ROCK-SH2]
MKFKLYKYITNIYRRFICPFGQKNHENNLELLLDLLVLSKLF